MLSGTFALYLCNSFVAFLIFAVFGLRKWRKLRFTMGDCWLAVALIFNGLRVVGDYYINKYGTPLSYAVYLATVPPTEAATLDLEVTPVEVKGLVLTGKLLIPTRVAMAVVMWSLNMAALDVLRKTLLRKAANKLQLFWSMYTVLALTFFVTILTAFIECQPLNLNWTLLPDVVNCSFGTAWIMTFEISNITIDYTMGVILVFLLLKPQTPKKDRLKLCVLGVWVIWGVVVMVRVIQGDSFNDVLQNKIVWGSVEVVFAASVATLPTIYILLLRPGSDEMPCDLAKEIHRVHSSSTTAVALVGQTSRQVDWPLQQGASWDNPRRWGTSISTDTASMHSTSKPIPRTSMQGSALNPPSVRAEDRNSWQALRDSLRHTHPGSRLSLGIEPTEENLHEALANWIELDEMSTSSLARELSSPEPEDAAGRDGGVFVATEVHRIWDDHRRPRIITIPRRAKLNTNTV